MSKKILVIDDEPDILELLRLTLTQEGFAVETASTAGEGLDAISKRVPDLLVLDLMLPDMSGNEVCRKLRSSQETAHLPVLMLTARSEETDRVVGFELGADDYVTKPFSPRELVLRIRAVLRRGKPRTAPTQRLEHETLTLDLERHRCRVADEEIELTAKEFGLLQALMSRPGRVLSREQLLEGLWGTDITVTHRTVDTHIKRLREKLGPAGKYVDTVRGVGYRFSD